MCEASANNMLKLKKKEGKKSPQAQNNKAETALFALCKQNVKENTDDTPETAGAQSEARMQLSLCCREIRAAMQWRSARCTARRQQSEHARREPTVPKTERAKGQVMPSLCKLSSGEGAWAAGKVADLMMSSADLLWRAMAAVSRVYNRGN